MIGDLSVLIQFLAAIYVTISLDNMIGRRFWSPDYYNLVDNQLSLVNKEFSSKKLKLLQAKIEEKEKSLESKSRKRGTYMLFVCVTFLVYIGFEIPARSESSENVACQFSPTVMLMMVSLVLLSSHFSLKTWNRTIVMCLMTVATMVVSLIFDGKLPKPNLIMILCNYMKILLVVIAMLPILYQLYVNWLYSKAYVIYLHSEISRELSSYHKAKSGIESGQGEMIPQEYNDVIKQLYVKKIDGDYAITAINNCFYELLDKICTPPTPHRLLVFCWKNRKLNLTVPTVSHAENEELLPMERDESPNQDVDGFELLFEEYEKMMPKIPLRTFCQNKHIDYNMFHAYYKMQLKKLVKKIK